MDHRDARQMWYVFEPIHDVTYFCAEPLEAGAALGFRGFWMAYFAFRSAPLGRCDPAVVTATFFGFHDSRIRRALPDAWAFASPADALAARRTAAATALQRMWSAAGVTDGQVAAAADELWQVSQRCSDAGRPMGAANRALPRPQDPVERLWQAATTLREHRGDGHVAVLVARGFSPVQAHLLKTATGEADEETLRSARAWPEPEWAAGEAQLAQAGLMREGRLTTLGSRAHEQIERATDECALQPWSALTGAALQEFRDRLEPLRRAVTDSGELPPLNPVGLGTGPDAVP